MSLTKEERTAINRRNASKSTGPRTPVGKLRSSMNSFRHGLTARHLTLHPEEGPAYMGHHQRTILSLRPWGPEEETLVSRIADCTWLIDRAIALEINSRAMAAMPLAESDEEISDETKPIDMIAITCADHHIHVQPMQQTERALKPRSGSSIEWIGRHRYRIERSVFKLTSDLKVIQKARIEFAAQTRILKTQHGNAYDPAIHGPFRDDDFNEAASPALAACQLPPKNEANAYDYRARLEQLAIGMEDNRPPQKITYTWAKFPFADGPQPTDPIECGGGGLPHPKPVYNYPTKKDAPKPDARRTSHRNSSNKNKKRSQSTPSPLRALPLLKKLFFFLTIALLTHASFGVTKKVDLFAHTDQSLTNNADLKRVTRVINVGSGSVERGFSRSPIPKIGETKTTKLVKEELAAQVVAVIGAKFGRTSIDEVRDVLESASRQAEYLVTAQVRDGELVPV